VSGVGVRVVLSALPGFWVPVPDLLAGSLVRRVAGVRRAGQPVALVRPGNCHDPQAEVVPGARTIPLTRQEQLTR
jgi:hypothetical protein